MRLTLISSNPNFSTMGAARYVWMPYFMCVGFMCLSDCFLFSVYVDKYVIKRLFVLNAYFALAKSVKSNVRSL